MTSAMTSCADWLNSTPAETKIERFGLSLWCQQKTNPTSEMTHCVSSKKLLFVMQNLEIWGIKRTWDQNMSSKVPYLESPTLICLFIMQLLWGYSDD